MSDEELLNRMRSTKLILESAEYRTYYKIVVNDDLDVAVDQVRRIIEDNDYTEQDHQAGLEAARKLLGWVNEYIAERN